MAQTKNKEYSKASICIISIGGKIASIAKGGEDGQICPDGARNLQDAALAATSPLCRELGVLVVMNGKGKQLARYFPD